MNFNDVLRKILLLVFLTFFFLQILPAQSAKNTGSLKVTILENNLPLPCNIQLKDENGIYWYPDSLYKFKDFNGKVFEEFPCDGKFKIALPYGKYEYKVSRGPAYKMLTGVLHINRKKIKLKWRLEKLVDLKQRMSEN